MREEELRNGRRDIESMPFSEFKRISSGITFIDCLDEKAKYEEYRDICSIRSRKEIDQCVARMREIDMCEHTFKSDKPLLGPHICMVCGFTTYEYHQSHGKTNLSPL